AITAPLATGYAITEILQFGGGQQSRMFRMVALSVILIGAAIALTGIRPIEIIFTAQIANGILLPVIAIVLLYVMNQSKLLGHYANGRLGNVMGGAVVMVATALGARLVWLAIS
ncbi:MAG: divalent metal cation transporter, partial [Altererythrobacter sp.]|nr:divalent metal cation transporter [Altererythrobacter sp.]